MQKHVYKIIACLIIPVTLIVSCKKLYNPPGTVNNYNYLVVEGVINTGQDSTVIKLSRTVNISAKTTVNPELNAVITIEDNNGGSYPLTGYGSGKYASAPLNTGNALQYRLRIKTSDGKTYLSDFTAAVGVPAIDSLGYTVQSNGIQLYVNAHDASNTARYYRWDYTETWIIQSQFDFLF